MGDFVITDTATVKSGGWIPAGTALARLSARTVSLMKEAECGQNAAYCIDPFRDPRWAALVDAHAHSSVFHSTKWLQALRTVYGYEPVVVTTCPPGAALGNGLVFCRVQSWLTGRRMVSLPFSDHCQPLADGPEGLYALLAPLKALVDRGPSEYFEIRPILPGLDETTGLRRFVTYQFHSLDLCPPAEQLFRNLHKDCIQRKIRRAEREKLQYEEGSSPALLRKFYALLVKTRRRHQLPPQPLAWFRGLAEAFGDDLKIRVASKNGLPVASILTLVHKKSMVYKYGCSDAGFHHLGATAFLFWRTILEAKDRGMEEFELGRSDADNAGLIAFKDRWGAVRRPVNYWTYPTTRATEQSSRSRKIASRIVPVVPDSVLKLAGTVFYRHIG